jgi:hypothetical protein
MPQKVKVICNISGCEEESSSIEAFEEHWREKHLVNYGWGCAHPRIVVEDVD